MIRRLYPRGAPEAPWHGRGRRRWYLRPESLRLLLSRRKRALALLGGTLAPELDVLTTVAVFTQEGHFPSSLLAQRRYRR